jgi:hypothetical protein
MEIALAFDGTTTRRIDQDGHLHVSIAPISKSNVCGYYGREIPDGGLLRLEPDKIYNLYRDPKELKQSAESFNGKPLLIVHKPQTADDHSHELTVGSVSNVEFDGTYLTAELVIWDSDAIARIESGEQKQLSSGYRYRADMTPGAINGQPYDGVMRDIIGNHVALVAEGRAGADVVIGDSANSNKEVFKMVKLSRQALYATGALRSYLRPVLAQDAKIDFGRVMDGVTAKNWDDKTSAIKIGLDAAIKGKLNADTDQEKVVAGLDEILATVAVDAKAMSMDDEEDMAAMDEDKEDDMKAKDKKAKDADPEDDEDDEDDMKKKKAEKDLEAKDKKKMGKDKETMDKPGMDAAIAAAVKAAEESTMRRLREIAEAEKVARPYIGEIAVAQDSAEAVYRLALDHLGIDVKGVHPSAFKTILKLQPEPGARPAAKEPRIATDAKALNGFAQRFPNAVPFRAI